MLLAEFGDGPLREAYYHAHRFDGLRVADPFMGGGTPLLEANRLGCDVMGWDVNPMAWWIVRQEYHCQACRSGHRGRFFKAPDGDDLARLAEAERRLRSADLSLVPDEPIPPGDETGRLHRWGYRRYREMFNPRQLLGLATLANRVAAVAEPTVREALATNVSDLLRYQNMLCRYDTRSLKSLDVFSVHGFPVGLVQCESNLLGIRAGEGNGANVGSGGWSNIVDKFARAKQYCADPFEIRYGKRGREVVAIPGEWIGDRRNGDADPPRRIDLQCASATEAELPDASLDAVLTDPPYFANVQYAELMEFCYVWLRRLAGAGEAAFAETTTHRPGDLTGNATLDRGLEHFVEGLSRVYQRLARALKPGHPFVFTYHHNALEAYYPVAVALLDAGLVCTAALPCPAEMGGSIHIHKSASSIVDTVFVCRTTGAVPTRLLEESDAEIAALITSDLERLREAGVPVTRGDARCVAFGHLIRLVVWELRRQWDRDATWREKLGAVGESLSGLPGWDALLSRLELGEKLVARRDEVRERVAEPRGFIEPSIAF